MKNEAKRIKRKQKDATRIGLPKILTPSDKNAGLSFLAWVKRCSNA